MDPRPSRLLIWFLLRSWLAPVHLQIMLIVRKCTVFALCISKRVHWVAFVVLGLFKKIIAQTGKCSWIKKQIEFICSKLLHASHKDILKMLIWWVVSGFSIRDHESQVRPITQITEWCIYLLLSVVAETSNGPIFSSHWIVLLYNIRTLIEEACRYVSLAGNCFICTTPNALHFSPEQ